MSAKAFVDANIFVYASTDSAAESDKRHIADELLSHNTECIVTSTQVVNEFFSAMRKNKIPDSRTILFANAILESMDVLPVTSTTLKSGWRILERYKLSYWDSLIVASALESGCEVLYSEDLQHSQLFDKKLKVVNPFLASKASRKH